MRTIKGLNLKLASQNKTTPLANFRVDPKDKNIKQCQSWNDYVMYQIKSTSKSGKTFAYYEIVKVIRKKQGNALHVYVLDRVFNYTDVVAACKYMNRLRRFVRATEVQQQICNSHKDQYIPHRFKQPINGRTGYVTLKYPESVKAIVDARRASNSKSNGGYKRSYNGYRRGGSSNYRAGGYRKAQGAQTSPF